MLARTSTTHPALAAAGGLLLGILSAGPSTAIDPGTKLGQLVSRSWTTTDGLPQNTVNDIVQTTDGYLWLATFGGLTRFDGIRFQVFDVASSDGLRTNRITALREDPGGGLWLGGDRGDVCRFLPERPHGRFTCFGPSDGLPAQRVVALFPDGDGTLWIATEKAVASLRDGRVRIFSHDADTIPTALVVDHHEVLNDWHGNVWFVDAEAGEAGSLGRLAPDSTDTGERLFEGQRVLSLYEDREGNVWVGTNNHGLHMLRDGIFENFHHSTSASAVLETAAGDVLFGTLCDGAFRMRDLDGGGQISPIPIPEGLHCVSAILEDRRGRLWVGAEELALREPDGRWTTYLEQAVRYQPVVHALFEDRSGAVWIGGRDVLARYLDGKLVRYNAADGVALRDIRCFLEDRRGDLWVAGTEGLIRFQGGMVTPESARHYSVADGLRHNFVRALHEDGLGGLWIGTYGGGLAHLDAGGTVQALTRADGLNENAISSIVEDEGSLWLSGNRGVTRLRRDEAEAFFRGEIDRVQTILYNENDGLRPSETNGGFQPAAWRMRDGRILYPTIFGVAAMDPSQLRLAEPPAVAIESVRVGRHEVTFGGGAPVVVEPGEWDLEVDYTALQLGLPEETLFRYRLVGHEDGWSEVGGRRTAYYTDVEPGVYRFELTAAAYAGGPWNDEVASVGLVFRPYLHQTLAFRVSAAATIAGLVVLGFMARIRNMRRHAEELNAVIAELETRNAEMERFTYTVSHDLRSPLVTIEGFTGYLLDDALAGDHQRVRDGIAQIRKATGKMSALLHDLLELSRIGRLANTPQKVSLTEAAHEARELVTGRLEQYGVTVEIEDGLPAVLADRPRLVEVFQNLLDNAARFMGDEPNPAVRVGGRHTQGNVAVVYVRDNGIGIPPEYHEKVFGLFSRLDVETEGTGVGLAIVRRIVEFHGGEIWVESEGSGHGTTFCFTWPEG